jgi:outer membrane lipoprotein-sorting protein
MEVLLMNKNDFNNIPGTSHFQKHNILFKLGIWIKKTWLRNWQRAYPGNDFRKGASIGVISLTALLAVAIGLHLKPGLWFILDILAGILVALIAAFLIGLAGGLVFKITSIIPNFINWKGLMAVVSFIVILIIFKFPFLLALVIGLGLGFIEATLGGSLAFIFSQDFRYSTWVKKIISILAVLATITINVYIVLWILDRGSDTHLDIKKKGPGEVIHTLSMPDPSLKGSHVVMEMTYGSGTDKRRPEFGKNANLRTRSVDVTPFLKENKNWTLKLRKWYWGFDFTKFPLNARLWYPGGEGPFGLILMVHGNHKMEEYSDPGYTYLGELLASRGFIAVSVDENFFNGSWASNLKNENDGRAWILLQHLKVWRKWNDSEGGPFYGKVDMENIALIGHSRGGEAVAIATLFNRLPRYPDDATVSFDFNFNIKSVVSMAPSEGQYKPSGKPTPMENINFLLLQGAHDPDAFSFMGVRQYNRLTFNDNKYWFKTILYSYRSNHGQFNTVWADADYGMPLSLLLNRKPYLTGEEQRKISSIYISAFLESTLHGKTDYIPLFRDHRLISEWMPDDIYITRFEDSTFQVLCNYEEDVDVTTATSNGATTIGNHLAVWKEADLAFRKHGTKMNTVVYLGWRKKDDKEQNPSYTIELPENFSSEKSITQESILVFSLADTGEEPPELEGEKKESKKEKSSEKDYIDLSIELVDAMDQRAKLRLNNFRKVPKILKSRFTRLMGESFIYGKDFEITLQNFELPVSAFTNKFQDFDLKTLKAIEFKFDQEESGVIVLDDIGFAQSPPFK